MDIANGNVKVKLPDKPSDLIELAMKDLAEVEKNSAYEVNMDWWHTNRTRTGKCAVCLAGAVMVQELGAKHGQALTPEDFDSDTEHKLVALDHFREGNVIDGLDCMGVEDLSAMEDLAFRTITRYSTSPRDFRSDMEELIHDLRAHGL